VKRGDVLWVEDPDVPRRPAVVMTRDEALHQLNRVFVVLATTTVRGLPTEVELGPEDGMPRECVLNADQAVSIPKVHFRETITVLGPEQLAAVCRALSVAHAC
jgi:mRNA interferase MazF